MSDAFVLASVTAALKRLLENELIAQAIPARIGGEVPVSALPPDRIATGAEERAQLNLFLWQITPNTTLRPLKEFSQADNGAPTATPSLAFDLHYLLTAYGATDFQIDILLGCAVRHVQRFREITREDLRKALTTVLPEDNQRATGSLERHIDIQAERLTMSPQFLNTEEASRLWSALQARYRPSVAYKVSLILFDDVKA
jgi:hypothetical protein